jgi:thiosulfate/3-mercaptopyruvate sulfurtransferase
VKGEFLKSTHGTAGCASCHGGDPAATTKERAHAGRSKSPSDAMDTQCAGCHAEVVRTYKTSLHFTTAGYDTVMQAKSGAKWPEVAPVVRQACHKCHASCGDCHVRWPAAAGGGLLDGHAFVKKPPVESTCNGCHSGRVSAEFFGWTGEPADVHFTRGKMQCSSCHELPDLHGDGTAYRYRLDRVSQPRCLGCHPDAASGKSTIEAHKVHGDAVECHVCHSVRYVNCYGCHVGKGAQSETDFRIGRNLRTDRPYRYNLVRHSPTTREMLASRVADALPHYDDAGPTWLPTFPHNIQRKTPQNASCNGCHGNAALFLRKDALDPRYPRANAAVAVSRIPPKR